MNIVVSDAKTGRALNTKTEKEVFVGKKLGEEVDLGVIGLSGYKAKITGGSDKQGFPMKPTVQGPLRRKVLLTIGVGFRSDRKGKKQKKTVVGNTVSANTAQVNVVITAHGEQKFEELLKTTAKPKEEKESVKERLVKESLEKAGSEELAHEKTKPKARR